MSYNNISGKWSFVWHHNAVTNSRRTIKFGKEMSVDEPDYKPNTKRISKKKITEEGNIRVVLLKHLRIIFSTRYSKMRLTVYFDWTQSCLLPRLGRSALSKGRPYHLRQLLVS